MQDNPTITNTPADEAEDPHEKKNNWLVPLLLGGLAVFGVTKLTQKKNIAEIIEKNGSDIGGGESEMISNILKAGDLDADDVMIPRADMTCLSVGMTADDIVKTIKETPHTRYAVYGEDKDDILGMLHIKDILISVAGKDKFILKDYIRPVMFVSPSMRAMDLLLRMRIDGMHLAMVVDEYGGIDGQISLEDLVEEVIGDIRDELDNGDEPTLDALPDGGYIIDGRYDLEELGMRIAGFTEVSQADDDEFDLEDIDTIGGLVMTLAGRMPLAGEIIRHAPSGWEFHVSHADPRRIRRLRMYRNTTPTEDKTENNNET